jgi:hypothetical protein
MAKAARHAGYELITYKEAAELLGISYDLLLRKVKTWTETEGFPKRSPYGGGIRLDQLLEWRARQWGETPPEPANDTQATEPDTTDLLSARAEALARADA